MICLLTKERVSNNPISFQPAHQLFPKWVLYQRGLGSLSDPGLTDTDQAVTGLCTRNYYKPYCRVLAK